MSHVEFSPLRSSQRRLKIPARIQFHRALTAGAERLLDLALQHAVDILRRDRPDQLERDSAIAADDKSFRHAVDAPLDRRASIRVDTDRIEWIAIAAEKASRVLRHILVVDADDLEAPV